MPLAAIPAWNPRGVLPPVDLFDPVSANRSPYRVSLVDLLMRFGTSPERLAILQGLLNFRAALHQMGLVAGFQWLDGSFLEDVEVLDKRPPRDIDVVTFLQTPTHFVPKAPHDVALDRPTAKAQFKVDSYLVELDLVPPAELALVSAYWYSLWSHRRNQEWKGFLQVDLAPHEDLAAQLWLSVPPAAGEQP